MLYQRASTARGRTPWPAGGSRPAWARERPPAGSVHTGPTHAAAPERTRAPRARRASPSRCGTSGCGNAAAAARPHARQALARSRGGRGMFIMLAGFVSRWWKSRPFEYQVATPSEAKRRYTISIGN